jgi:Zn-dependent M16 (insulinase) family peptidase
MWTNSSPHYIQTTLPSQWIPAPTSLWLCSYFCLYFRDPNSLNTLARFDESTLWAAEGKFTDQDIDEAKLAVFQEVDQPVAPGDKGMVTFLTGISDEMKQVQRERLFDANKKSLMSVAQK